MLDGWADDLRGESREGKGAMPSMLATPRQSLLQWGAPTGTAASTHAPTNSHRPSPSPTSHSPSPSAPMSLIFVVAQQSPGDPPPTPPPSSSPSKRREQPPSPHTHPHIPLNHRHPHIPLAIVITT